MTWNVGIAGGRWGSQAGSEQQRDYNDRIRKHEGRSSGAERDLLEKYHDVYNYDAPCHPGHASSCPRIVFDRNHLLPPSTLKCMGELNSNTLGRLREHHPQLSKDLFQAIG